MTNNIDKQPQLIKPIKSLSTKPRAVFHLKLSEYFSPNNVQFSLIGTTPPWLSIDKHGAISGIIPNLARTTQYLITVKASNASGEVSESFMLNVVCGTFISSITQATLNLTLNKRQYELVSKHPMTHDVLRYLYEYYRASKEWKIFANLIREEASHMNIKVSNKLDYHDFKKVIQTKQPMIEKHLRKKVGDDHLLVEAEMRNAEMRNLFRQGSQPQGAHAREVWNYLCAPSLHNWTHVKTVLHLSVEALIAQYQEAHKHELSRHHNAPKLTIMPKDWHEE